MVVMIGSREFVVFVISKLPDLSPDFAGGMSGGWGAKYETVRKRGAVSSCVGRNSRAWEVIQLVGCR